jgi:hypothetical protein
VGLVWFWGEGGSEEDLEGFYDIWWIVMLEFRLKALSWRCVCVTPKKGKVAWDCNVLVWYFNGKLLKNLNGLSVNLCIKKWKKFVWFKLHNVLLHFIKCFCVSSTKNGKNVCEVFVFGVKNYLLSQEDNNW